LNRERGSPNKPGNLFFHKDEGATRLGDPRESPADQRKKCRPITRERERLLERRDPIGKRFRLTSFVWREKILSVEKGAFQSKCAENKGTAARRSLKMQKGNFVKGKGKMQRKKPNARRDTLTRPNRMERGYDRTHRKRRSSGSSGGRGGSIMKEDRKGKWYQTQRGHIFLLKFEGGRGMDWGGRARGEGTFEDTTGGKPQREGGGSVKGNLSFPSYFEVLGGQ